MKKSILYARVSTDEQAIKGHSLYYQREQLVNYCKTNKINNYKYYEEDGQSGKNLNRPKIKQIFNEILLGDVSRIIILSVDRLTRNIEDYLKITKMLDSFDIELISLTENLTNDAMGEFVQHILIAKAQMEVNIQRILMITYLLLKTV